MVIWSLYSKPNMAKSSRKRFVPSKLFVLVNGKADHPAGPIQKNAENGAATDQKPEVKISDPLSQGPVLHLHHHRLFPGGVPDFGGPPEAEEPLDGLYL